MEKQIVGLVGYPLKHSLSPAFQQPAFDYYHLPVRYVAWETPPDKLADVVKRLREPEYLGMNVTVPHKEAIIPMLDELGVRAKQIGAVNTVVKPRETGGRPLSALSGGSARDWRLLGFNTDAEGFLAALEKDARYDLEDKRVVMLGSGGAARAVAFTIVEGKARELTIINRHIGRAQSLAVDLYPATAATKVTVLPWDDATLRSALKSCDLLVNTTPMGMKHTAEEDRSPVPAAYIPPGALVFDLVYNPLVTKLLREAEAAGARTLGGLSMLVYQGAASFELWTGQKAPVGLMFERARQAIAG